MFRTVLALLIILVAAIETTHQVAESQAAKGLVRTRLQSLRRQARQVRREMQYIDSQLAQLPQEQDRALWASVEVSSEALADRIRGIYDARKAQLQQRQEYLATLLEEIDTQIVKRAERPDSGERPQ